MKKIFSISAAISVPQSSYSDNKELHNFCTALQVKNSRIKNLLAKYPTSKSLIDICVNRGEQRKMGNCVKYVFLNKNAPTLALIGQAYPTEKNPAAALVVKLLFQFGEYCGAEKMNEYQLEECAYAIVDKFFYLKVTELMYFFLNLRRGKYVKFYKTIDPLNILEAMGNFIEERARIIVQFQGEELEKQYEEEKRNAISREEYLRLKKIENDG